MDQCSDHKECSRKIFEACQAVGIATNKLIRLERDMEGINITIFGEGDANSLKSRIKGTEDAVDGLKELVLENREVVTTNMKGLFNVFRLTIAAASVLIIIAFGVMWAELRGVNDTVDKIQMRQMRQPLVSSHQLPLRPNESGDR